VIIALVMIITARSRGPANGFDGEEMKFPTHAHKHIHTRASVFFPPSKHNKK